VLPSDFAVYVCMYTCKYADRDDHMHRNDRNVRNTPYQFLPSRIEQASIETVCSLICPVGIQDAVFVPRCVK
jgi:hypothetical protein